MRTEGNTVKLDLPYIHEDVDRHGNVRVYFRRRGFGKVRMRDPVGSAAFMEIYQDLKAASDAGQPPPGKIQTGPKRSKPGSWRALCEAYFASATFLQRLGAATQRDRRRILESTFDEPIHPGAKLSFGEMPASRFGAKAVKVLRDRKADLPEAANGRIKAISTVFAWAIEDERPGILRNPARDIARIKTGSTGFHTWTVEEVAQFEAHHKIGTKARLAMALLLLTGVRRSDVVRLGRPHLRGGRLEFTAWKNRNRAPVQMNVPVLPELQNVLESSELGKITFLVTSFGLPFTAAGFGNWFRGQCNAAGLQQCSAHGLRKAGSTRAAENGATPHQLMAMFGWTTIQQAEIYTKAAARKRLASDGMHLIVGEKGTK